MTNSLVLLAPCSRATLTSQGKWFVQKPTQRTASAFRGGAGGAWSG
jgi:hypothetical protein